jgi:hypothetical protein
MCSRRGKRANYSPLTSPCQGIEPHNAWSSLSFRFESFRSRMPTAYAQSTAAAQAQPAQAWPAIVQHRLEKRGVPAAIATEL